MKKKKRRQPQKKLISSGSLLTCHNQVPARGAGGGAGHPPGGDGGQRHPLFQPHKLCLQVRPSHVTVARCAGSCPSSPGQDCLPLHSVMVGGVEEYITRCITPYR